MSTAPVVVDASVAVKWVLDESDAERAEALLTDCLRAARVIATPPHLHSEAGNAIYQRTRISEVTLRLSPADAIEALSELLEVPIELIAPHGLYERALAFAQLHGLPSIYDALYVVLAQLLGAELWTADQRLLTAVGGAAPWVRAIRDYPAS